jgi:hypothetical protein
MSNKSGFEIRADLLQQAQAIIMDQHYQKVQATEYNNQLLDQKNPLPTLEITTGDIIARAKELYEFVNEK